MRRTITVNLQVQPPITYRDVWLATGGEVNNAIAYLSTWALMGQGHDDVSHVELTISGYDYEISALYGDPANADRRRMLMVAVWRESEAKYTFHT